MLVHLIQNISSKALLKPTVWYFTTYRDFEIKKEKAAIAAVY